MTDQITVPRETWDAMREALRTITSLQTNDSATEWNMALIECDGALTAADAVSHPNPETAPLSEGGAITSESAANAVSTFGTLINEGTMPQAQGDAEYFGLEPWERPASVPVATMIFPKHSPTKPFVALGDCAKLYPDAAQCKPLFAHPQATEPQEAIAWEATTPVYTKYVTDKRYRSFSDAAKRWYKPYKCSSCHHQATESAGYKLVPVEPTLEMCVAGSNYMNSRTVLIAKNAHAFYKAMVAAAPEAKQ